MSLRISYVLAAGIVTALVCTAAVAQELTGYTGKDLYRMYCASCHGVEGHGNGPVAATPKRKVPDLTRIAARHGGTFPADQVRTIIDGRTTLPAHGTPDMPVWGWALRAPGTNDPQNEYRAQGLIGLLVEYLTTIQRP
jgi:mono/diheme cytochrome c family protein